MKLGATVMVSTDTESLCPDRSDRKPSIAAKGESYI